MRSHNCLDISKAAREDTGFDIVEDDEFRPTNGWEGFNAGGGMDLGQLLKEIKESLKE